MTRMETRSAVTVLLVKGMGLILLILALVTILAISTVKATVLIATAVMPELTVSPRAVRLARARTRLEPKVKPGQRPHP